MKKSRHMSKKIDIILLYLSDYTKVINGRTIAKQIAVNHQTALNHLNNLTKEGILKFKKEGRNKNYYLNLDDLKTLLFIEIAENYKAYLRLEKKELLVIIEDLLQHSEGLILFGSYADFSETKSSDIDLVVVGKANKTEISKIVLKYPQNIHVEFISLSDLKKSFHQKKALAKEILKKHILYGSINPIIKIFLDYYKR